MPREQLPGHTLHERQPGGPRVTAHFGGGVDGRHERGNLLGDHEPAVIKQPWVVGAAVRQTAREPPAVGPLDRPADRMAGAGIGREEPVAMAEREGAHERTKRLEQAIGQLTRWRRPGERGQDHRRQIEGNHRGGGEACGGAPRCPGGGRHEWLAPNSTIAQKNPRATAVARGSWASVLGVRGLCDQRIDAVASTAAVRLAAGSSASSMLEPAASSIVFTIDRSSPSTTCVTRTS